MSKPDIVAAAQPSAGPVTETQVEAPAEPPPAFLADYSLDAGECWRETGDYAACAAAFIELYEQDPDHAQADVALWNAASCREEEGRVGEAIALRTTLIQRFGSSGLALDALHAQAESHAVIGMFEASAGLFEVFVEQAPEDPRSLAALERAYELRVGLGQKQAAAANFARFEQRYAKHEPKRFAALVWSTREQLGSDTERLAHARAYLEDHREAGGLERELLAEAMLAEADWLASCSVESNKTESNSIASNTGLCTSLLSPRQRGPRQPDENGRWPKFRPPKYCGGPDSHPMVVVEKRSSKHVARAQLRFERILEIGKALDSSGGAVEFASKVARARGMTSSSLADREFERLLQFTPPEELDFMIEEWREDSGIPAWERKYAEQVHEAESSKVELAAFIAASRNEIAPAMLRYEEAVELGGPRYQLLAAVRQSVFSEAMSGALAWAKIPRDFDQEQVWKLCDTLAAEAEVFMLESQQGYESCLSHALDAQYSDDVSQLCERELDGFLSPGTREIRDEGFGPGGPIDATRGTSVQAPSAI